MAKVSGLVDRLPRDGVPISEQTDVFLGYDGTSLHAVFVCFDRDPAQIRAHLNGRDKVPDSEDSVALQIDTFRDRKHAYGFQTNALGVQQDGMWTEGQGWDLSFDTVWRTDTRRTAVGYLVLVSVPFKSLRFPRDEVQHWGFLVFRGVARRNEEAFWPAYSTRIAGRMNQAGIMEGLERVSPGRNAQVIPFVSTRSFRALAIGPDRARMVSDPFQAALGADAKLVIKNSVSVDLTANPDFSQVESDEPQVTVNKRFETFFPEKRPFFLENASYFDTPIPLLFTRRIADPDAGARVTGRLGRYAFGALAVGDRPGPGSARVGVLRVNRDIGAESSVGLFSSSRTHQGGVNRLGGFDSRLKFGAHWFAAIQAVASDTRELNGRDLAGSAYRATVLRSGRNLSYRGDFNDRSPGFRTTLGFVERTDIRSLDQTLSYRWMPSGSRLLSWGPDLTVAEVRDHHNHPLDRTIAPRLVFEWPGLTRLSVTHQDARVRLRPQEVANLLERAAFSLDQTGAEFATSFTRYLTLTVKGSRGDGINLVPLPGERASAARSNEIVVTTEVRPGARLNLATSYLRTVLSDPDGARLFGSQIGRARLNYQFTRSLSIRAIIQSDRLAAVPARTLLESHHDLNLDVLFTYLRTPGTALYIGYNNNLQDIDPGLRLGTNGRLLRSPGGLSSDGRQFFVKASYLFRP